MKLTKEQFWKFLDFLSNFSGLNDLSDEDYKEELWGYYEEENN